MKWTHIYILTCDQKTHSSVEISQISLCCSSYCRCSGSRINVITFKIVYWIGGFVECDMKNSNTKTQPKYIPSHSCPSTGNLFIIYNLYLSPFSTSSSSRFLLFTKKNEYTETHLKVQNELWRLFDMFVYLFSFVYVPGNNTRIWSVHTQYV